MSVQQAVVAYSADLQRSKHLSCSLRNILIICVIQSLFIKVVQMSPFVSCDLKLILNFIRFISADGKVSLLATLISEKNYSTMAKMFSWKYLSFSLESCLVLF